MLIESEERRRITMHHLLLEQNFSIVSGINPDDMALCSTPRELETNIGLLAK